MLTLIRETNVDYTKELITTIGDVLADAEAHGVSPTPAMKRLAAYGLLVEAQIDLQDQATDWGQGVQFTPEDGMDFKFEPEIKRKNGRKNCKECREPLSGKQRLFCSKLCAKRSWIKDNPEKVKASYNRYDKKKRARQNLKIVK
jgi:hypothetical protein